MLINKPYHFLVGKFLLIVLKFTPHAIMIASVCGVNIEEYDITPFNLFDVEKGFRWIIER
jgi:hypothetical protein